MRSLSSKGRVKWEACQEPRGEQVRAGGETKSSFRDFSVNSLMLLAKDGIVPSRPEGGLP